VPVPWGGQQEARRAERLHETLPSHRSNPSFCNRRGPSGPEPVLVGAEVEKDWQLVPLPPGALPDGHLEVMAMLQCPYAQGRHAEGPDSVLEMCMGWWYPTPALVFARLPSHWQPQESICGSSAK